MSSDLPPSDLATGQLESSSGRTKIAVWGLGSIGRRHHKLLDDRSDIEAVAIPSRPERVPGLRRDGVNAVASLNDAVESGVKAVIVATDTGRHEQDASAALSSGCDVLVEKPMALNAAGAARVIATSEEFGTRVHVASCLRFDAGLQWVRSLLHRVGDVSSVEVECRSWLPNWRPGRNYAETYAARSGEGGVLRDLIHEIDYVLWLFGAIELLEAELGNSGQLDLPDDVEDSAMLCGRVGRSQATTVIRLDFASRDESRCLRIVGSEGELDWDYRARQAHLRSIGGELKQTKHWKALDIYKLQLDAWIRELEGYRDPNLSTASEGAAALAVCDRARVLGHWPDGGS